MVEKEIKEGNVDTKEEAEQKEQSAKEKRVRQIAISYYSRGDVRKALFDFSKNRECVPRYFEGFGKRPDSFSYDSDIFELAKKGATSFHCSEELWKDPLALSTGMSSEELKKNRIGFDLIIDVDSKYLDYSKIYAEILIEVLRNHGIKNINVKFSGSKGWHIIVPWKAFPKEISGNKTCEMFPEWPRLIIGYLRSKITEKLKDRVLDLSDNNDKSENKTTEIYCFKCNNAPEKKEIVYFKCRSCKTQMQNMQDAFARKRVIRCPNCQIEMNEEKREDILYCINCKISSKIDKDNFKERVHSKHIDADLVLVSSRHLFRMPYSLHEKTALVSVVVKPEEIKNFDMIRDANPLKVIPRDFVPEAEEGEATSLLREALEFKSPENEESNKYNINYDSNKKTGEKGKKDFSDFKLDNLNPDMYSPVIKTILQGMKSDGRKRALFILLSYFRSLKVEEQEIIKIIEEWNKKNYEPLQQGYIKSQIEWNFKNKPKMPPNFDKPYYKEIGLSPSVEEINSKNPVSFTIKKALRRA